MRRANQKKECMQVFRRVDWLNDFLPTRNFAEIPLMERDYRQSRQWQLGLLQINKN